MKLVREDFELYVRISRGRSKIGEVLSLLADRSIEVHGANTYPEGYGTALFLITSDPLMAERVLREAGHHCELNQVMWVTVVPYRPGVIAQFAFDLIRSGIRIVRSHIYSPVGSQGCVGVFQTSNDNEAGRVLAGNHIRIAA